MRTILQTKPMVGSRKPYGREEWIRTVDKGGYMEIEFPFPNQNRIGTPEGYFFLYLMPRQDYSFALAYPFDGFHELVERILSEDVYESAFRQEWPRFDNMLITDEQKMLSEFAKRPIQVIFRDSEDDFKSKWVVASQIAVPAGASNVVHEAELRGLESLIAPTVSLHVEVTDAVNRVVTGQITGRYKFPKSGFEKFKEAYDKVEPYLGLLVDALKAGTNWK